MSAFGSEFLQSLRALRTQPASTLLIVAVLTLGLAGVISMVTVIKGLVWNPLPFPNADQVLHVGWLEEGNRDGEPEPLNRDGLVKLRAQVGDAAQLASAAIATINVSDAVSVARYDGAFVTHNLFSMFGIEPMLGRGLRPEDDAPGAPIVLLISHAVWRDRFGGASDVLGRAVRVNGEPATIIGVMPPGFAFPRREQAWAALRPQAGQEDFYGLLFAQLAPGESAGALRSAIERWLDAERLENPDEYRNAYAGVSPVGHLYADNTTRDILGVMLATVFMVLLVACANAASVTLARTLARSRDLAVRLTLGASRWRVAAHLLAQSLWMNGLALVLALPLADFALDRLFGGFQGTDEGPPPWMSFEFDSQLVLFAAGVALLSSIVVALLPVLRLRVDALGASLRDGGRAVAGGSSTQLARWLVSAQLALACVVLMMTLATVRGVDSLVRTDLGVDTERLLTARIGLFPSGYPDDAAVLSYFESLVQRLEREPGVESATATTTLPGQNAQIESAIPAGFDVGDDGAPDIRYGAVDPGFFKTFNVRLRAGRGIEARDNAEGDAVMVIDQSFADQYFAGQDPIGQTVLWNSDGEQPQTRTVIGVVDTLVLDDVNDDVLPGALLPLAQMPVRFASVALRTNGDPIAFKRRFTEVLREHDPETPAYWLRSYEEVLRVALAGERVVSSMFTAFGVVALLLAAVGLYGLISELVAQRTREIGVQRALGAGAAKILYVLMRKSLPQVLVGLGVGLALAVPSANLLSGVLNIPPDHYSILVLIAMLVGIATLAILLPASRALSVDPTVALRSE